MIFNLKSKGRTHYEIGQGYMNGSVPPPPLPNVITGSKKLLRVEKRKNNSRFKNQLIETRQSLIYTPVV